MADDFSSEVDEIIGDTLTGDDGSLDKEMSESQHKEESPRGDSEESGNDADDLAPSIQNARTRREELWEGLNRPPNPENIVSHVCEIIGLSESVQNEALDLIKKANDAGLPIHRTRVVWSLSAIKQASEIHGESVEWQEITDLTDMNRQSIEGRTEDIRNIS